MSGLVKTQGWSDLLDAQKNGVVIGLKGVTGVVERLDIDELLLKKPDTFNLFLLALRGLQEDTETTDPMGYFQIAGIHGLPRTLWNNVPEPRKEFHEKPDNYGSGYCAHGDITFPTWHRPYLAMMEQTLFVKMVEIAQKFANSEKYLKEAQSFRLPYWDYYRPRSYETVFPGITIGQDISTGAFVRMEFKEHKDVNVFDAVTGKQINSDGVEVLNSTKYPYDFGIPQIFMLEKVMTRLPPHGNVKLEHNPLRTFWFPTNDEIPESHWKSMRLNRDDFSRGHTVRHLLLGCKSPFQGTNIRMNHTLNKVRDNTVSQILNMISNDPGYDKYEVFATNESHKGQDRHGSLEGLHNSYHVNIGGSGHMGQVPVAAFDPVFWMHHANIDRYLAIWQAAHPNAWIDSDTGRLKEELKSLENDLKPFYKTANTFWTSMDAEDTQVFGYRYADVKKTPKETKELFRHRHTWSIRPELSTPEWMPNAPPEMEPLDLSGAQVYVNHPEYLRPTPPPKAKTPEKSSVTKIVGGNRQASLAKRREWFVDDTVERLGLNGSFSIDYFIGLKGGAVTVPPQDYSLAPTLAGSTYIFSSPREACGNCEIQQQRGHLVSDTTPITPILMDYIKIGQLTSLEPEHVKPFLTSRLRWRVQMANGETVDPRILPGLDISISSKVSSEPVDAEPPVIEDYSKIIADIKENASTEAEHIKQSTQ